MKENSSNTLTLDGFRRFVQSSIGFREPPAENQPLLSTAVLDSFLLENFLSQVETTFGLKIDLSEIGADNFNTPQQMFAFISTRLSSKG